MVVIWRAFDSAKAAFKAMIRGDGKFQLKILSLHYFV